MRLYQASRKWVQRAEAVMLTQGYGYGRGSTFGGWSTSRECAWLSKPGTDRTPGSGRLLGMADARHWTTGKSLLQGR